jgi:hypothetical protein
VTHARRPGNIVDGEMHWFFESFVQRHEKLFMILRRSRDQVHVLLYTLLTVSRYRS